MGRVAKLAALGVVLSAGWMAGCEMPAVSNVPAVASVESTMDAASMRGSWVHRDESEGKVLVARIAPWDERMALCVLEGDLFTGELDSKVMLKVWGYTDGDREYVCAGWLFFPKDEEEGWGIDEEDAGEIGLSREEIERRLDTVEREEGTAVFYTAVIERGEDSMVIRTISPLGSIGHDDMLAGDPRARIDRDLLRAWISENQEHAGEEPYGVTLRFTRVTEEEVEEALEGAGEEPAAEQVGG